MFAVNTVLTVAAAISVWLLFRLIRYYRNWAKILAPVPRVKPHHWFWGMLHVVSDSENFYKLMLANMYARPNKSPFRIAYYWYCVMYPVVGLFHPASLKALLSATDVPKNRDREGPYTMFQPWIGDGIVCSNGHKWGRNRRLLTPAFHFDILKPYVGVVQDVADIFLDKLAELSRDGRSVDIYPHVSKATLDTVLRCALSYEDRSVQEGDHHPYVRAVQRLAYLVLNRVLTPWNHYDWLYALRSEGREFKRLCNYVHGFSSNIIEERKGALASDPTQTKKRHLDFLDILLTAKDETGVGLTDLEIRDEVDTFMFAGHDTTASAISWAMHHLAKYPDMQQRVRDEVADLLEDKTVLEADDLHKLTYTTCFIKESMRMYPPGAGVTRKLNKPLTIEGVTFPAGVIFDVHIYPMHHNEEVWKNHMEFRPERFFPENIKDKDAYAFLPFSAGQRNCIGQHFALNEVKVLISRIVTRFEVSLDPERVAEPFPELIIRAKNGIYLNFRER